MLLDEREWRKGMSGQRSARSGRSSAFPLDKPKPHSGSEAFASADRTDRTDSPARRASTAGSPRSALSRQLKEVKSCQQLLQLLRNQPPEALTAVNIATAWVRLGSVQSRGPLQEGGEKSAYRGGSSGGTASVAEDKEKQGDDDDDDTESTSPCTAVVRQLLEPTATAANEMDLRQIANVLWGMAKVGDRALMLSKRSGRDGFGNAQGGDGYSPRRALQRLQDRAVELLQQLLAPPPPEQLLLDVRDATQIWYGMAGLSHQYSWSDSLCTALEAATLQAMEAGRAAEAAYNDTNGPLAGMARSGGVGSGGGRTGSSWAENRTRTAQIVFRMAAVSGAKMNPGHKARLAAVIDVMSYGDTELEYNASPPLENPDCLLVGAQLLRLELRMETVRRLHDMALALPPEAAARTGRTAMARALNSAVGLGYQPTASEARRWERRLVEELGGDDSGGGGGGSGGRWTCEGLSWTVMALSSVKAYLPDEDMGGVFVGALRRLVRQLRSNDATRVAHAMRAWGLRLPEREAALLRQKAAAAAAEGPVWSGGDGAASTRSGGGGGRDFAFRSWGFRR
ncbi:hypothetical protein VOLCADRAFT_105033 [Volvox carteri f. nagariensis]|uniref:Uncharacterized protein n=1 Tax=Volvox carteri f. nagariensis TaxID=3068 RepID=D8TXX8_VOLCA|nr:uncharacterized protein VOLCADRAFT_105033 [Volvox carteri f. nagariensis]EFJ47720.1 hypothetical protein VOLCADRAFT_105033 [Volvox carteri f. nagariensis]|eukprot:XP_002951191.1 hypothetical protein VOLCADRAFT_105033 [Volvox carteri f. nagariensis]